MNVPKEKLGVLETLKVSSLAFSVIYCTIYVTKTNKHLSAHENILIGGISELIKALVCFTCSFYREGYESAEYLKGYMISGILSSLQSLTWMQVSQIFPNLIVLISAQTRIFFVFLMAIVFLNRRYTKIQYSSQGLLLLGVFTPLIFGESESFKSESSSFIDYLMLVSLPILSACTGIVFEVFVAPKMKSKWKSAVNHSGTSAAISFLIIFCIFCAGKLNISYDHIKEIMFVSLVKSGDSLVFGYFVIKYTTLIRILITLAISPLSSFIISYQFSEDITGVKIASVAVILLSILMFHIPYYRNRQITNK
ncbi:hypothetical protein NEIG_01450 [Nematocida sp. ERTm5]|nr:hypothetical protein NEIG_01450 [Nematocida sp. ERTm5]